MTPYLSLAEFWHLAEHVTGINSAADGSQNRLLTPKAHLSEWRLDLSSVL